MIFACPAAQNVGMSLSQFLPDVEIGEAYNANIHVSVKVS